MNKLLLVASLLIMTLFVNAQYLVSATEIENRSASQVHSILSYWGWDPGSTDLNSVISYKITYNTIDVNGAPTIASGALYVPQIIDCDTLPLVSWQHGTVFEKIWVPSNNHDYEYGLLFSGNGYLTTLPDYLGLGENPGHHPYVHWESEATASIDLIRAAREFLNASHQIWDNNQLFLSGYSQGGHSAMALHKYIETNNLENEFNVVASAPGSGVFPLYDAQFPVMLDEDSSFYAAQLFPYTFASYQLVYGNLYANYNEYYDPPYDSIIADWLDSGLHWAGDWAELIPDNFYDFMLDSVLDNVQSNPDHPINIALRENDLHNWIPQKPVRMLYCGMDTLAFPQNSIMAQDTMNALGASDIQAIDLDPNADHYGCIVPATAYALEWFDSLRVECEMVHVSIRSFNEQPEISLYPNPASTQITIELPNTPQRNSFLTIYNINSQQLITRRITEQKTLVDVSGLPSGFYFVKVADDSTVIVGKVMKK